MRPQFLKVAQQQVDKLKKRDEIIGLGLYGSVAYNKVTPFSDIDIFIITAETEHKPSIEHRLCDGIRTDFIWEPLESWQKITYNKPQYIPWYLVKALLLGSDDMIMYDPQEVIRTKRNELRQEVTYEHFIAKIIASEINYIIDELAVAIWHEEGGRFLKSWDSLSRWATDYLLGILNEFTNSKHIEEALQIINISGLADCVKEIISLKCMVNGITPEYVRNLHKIDKDHWKYQIDSIWEPLRNHLIKQGVDSPEKLEVTGELILPYGGIRIYELGRVLEEHSFSLRWAKYELDHGNVLEALSKICYEDIINDSYTKWTRINDAINSAGLDADTIVKEVLTSSNFNERTETAKMALHSIDAVEVTASYTNQLISSAYEYLRLLSEYWVLHYPDFFGSMPAFFTLSHDEIAQERNKREICIDNELAFLTVSKERAAVKELSFKAGTNANLIETFWNDACLFDLSSTSHQELSGKWILDKEEIGDKQSEFVFIQEGYKVKLNISISEEAITVSQSFRLSSPIAINNNISIGGKGWPKPKDDYWATMIDGKIEVGNYTYGSDHIFIYPSDGRYFTPKGCWIATWNENTDEVYGFTFSPNCGCIIACGAGDDFEFYLPAGESTLRFHVIKHKPTPPYNAIQQWEIANEEAFLGPDGEEPHSPYLKEQD